MPCPHQFPSQAVFCLAQWAPNLDGPRIHLREDTQGAWKHIALWGKSICFMPFITGNWQVDTQEFVLNIYSVHKCAKYSIEITRTWSLPSAPTYVLCPEVSKKQPRKGLLQTYNLTYYTGQTKREKEGADKRRKGDFFFLRRAMSYGTHEKDFTTRWFLRF